MTATMKQSKGRGWSQPGNVDTGERRLGRRAREATDVLTDDSGPTEGRKEEVILHDRILDTSSPYPFNAQSA